MKFNKDDINNTYILLNSGELTFFTKKLHLY